MRKLLTCLFVLFILLISSVFIYGKSNSLIRIGLRTSPLEEWKSPSKYSPINDFDDNLNTCYAEGMHNSHRGRFEIYFDKYIDIDEIKFAPGYFKNKTLFKKNNRVKRISLYFKNKDADKVEIIHYNFNDNMEIQSKKLKSIKIDKILFSIDDVYKGSKYNDTCISEIKFYNKGEEIHISNRERLHKQYVENLENNLKELFQDKKYEFNLCNDGSVFFSSDGTIKHKLYGPCEAALPERWKITDARLFFYY